MMFEGVCIDTGQTTVLEKGRKYYLFPNGSHHYYVSIFQNPHTHKGCFESSLFQIMNEEEWPQEPEVKMIHLDKEKIYKASLAWRKPGHQSVPLKKYFVRAKNTHGYFYEDPNLETCRGCFPLHWFSEFVEADQEVEEQLLQEEESFIGEEIVMMEEPIRFQYEQLSLF
jgi:hypothetical protein